MKLLLTLLFTTTLFSQEYFKVLIISNGNTFEFDGYNSDHLYEKALIDYHGYDPLVNSQILIDKIDSDAEFSVIENYLLNNHVDAIVFFFS